MITTSIVAYLALFVTVGFLFLFAALLLGRFLRARVPTGQKLDIYECGEQAVGSAQVRFDLRFYVVALVFLVFDVEVAFFFPWAVVFGGATQRMGENVSVVAPSDATGTGPAGQAGSGARAENMSTESVGTAPISPMVGMTPGDARSLALAAMADIAVFFGVLMVGFAYVWYRGDLDWVRAVGRQPSARSTP
jgi:NADH-quinone oxidoreductase subunit A